MQALEHSWTTRNLFFKREFKFKITAKSMTLRILDAEILETENIKTCHFYEILLFICLRYKQRLPPASHSPQQKNPTT